MSSLGARRKARVIQTLDDDDLADNSQDSECFSDSPSRRVVFLPVADPNKVANALLPGTPQVEAPIKFTRKPNKSSSLRKSINIGDIDRDADGGAPVSDAGAGAEDSGMPVVIRPSVSR